MVGTRIRRVRCHGPGALMAAVERMRGGACPVCFPDPGPERRLMWWEIYIVDPRSSDRRIGTWIRACFKCSDHQFVTTEEL